MSKSSVSVNALFSYLVTCDFIFYFKYYSVHLIQIFLSSPHCYQISIDTNLTMKTQVKFIKIPVTALSDTLRHKNKVLIIIVEAGMSPDCLMLTQQRRHLDQILPRIRFSAPRLCEKWKRCMHIQISMHMWGMWSEEKTKVQKRDFSLNNINIFDNIQIIIWVTNGYLCFFNDNFENMFF